MLHQNLDLLCLARFLPFSRNFFILLCFSHLSCQMYNQLYCSKLQNYLRLWNVTIWVHVPVLPLTGPRGLWAHEFSFILSSITPGRKKYNHIGYCIEYKNSDYEMLTAIVISSTFVTTRMVSTTICRIELRIISSCFRIFQNRHSICNFWSFFSLLYSVCFVL